MSRLKNFLTSVKWNQVLVVFLAGFLLLVSTACSRPDSPRASGESSYQDHRAQRTDFDASAPERVGGMNQYRDTTRDTSAADAKARQLIQNARANENKVNKPQDFVQNFQEGRPLGDRVRNVAEDVSETAANAAEDFKQGTQRGIRNLRENTQDAADTASRTADQASRTASNAARDTAKATQRAAQDAADNVRSHT